MSEEPNEDSGRSRRRKKKKKSHTTRDEQIRKDFAALAAIFESPLPEDDDGIGTAPGMEKQRRADLMLEFAEKYRDDLLDVDFAGQTVDELIASLRKKKEECAVAQAKVEETQGKVYEAAAEVGRSLIDMNVALFHVMSDLEALTSERWNAMSVEQRTSLADLLLQWINGERERCLSELPIEIRRKLEGESGGAE